MTCLRNPGELQLKQPLLAIKEEIRVNLKTLIFEGDSLARLHRHGIFGNVLVFDTCRTPELVRFARL